MATVPNLIVFVLRTKMNLSLLETVNPFLQWTKDEECLYDLHTPLFFSAMTGATHLKRPLLLLSN